VIDFSKMETVLPDIGNVPIVDHQFKMFDLDFVRNIDNTFYVANRESRSKYNFEGFDIRIFRGLEPKLQISNSIHKFFTKGINWNDFTLTNLYDSIEMLSSHFGIEFMDAKLFGKFEIAVNIKESYDVVNNAILYSHGNIKPEPMRGKSKHYGVRFQLETKGVKLYCPLKKIILAKSLVRRPPENLLRFELATSISKLKSKGIGLGTVKTLFDPIVLDRLGEELVKSASKILFEDKIPDNLTPKECVARALHDSDEYFSKYIENVSRDTVKRHRKTLRDSLKKASTPIDISEKVKSKWQELINQ